jgi:hypothetical protein
MKALLYRYGWPWFFRFTRRCMNLDIEKEHLPNGGEKYTWCKWMPNDQLDRKEEAR